MLGLWRVSVLGHSQFIDFYQLRLVRHSVVKQHSCCPRWKSIVLKIYCRSQQMRKQGGHILVNSRGRTQSEWLRAKHPFFATLLQGPSSGPGWHSSASIQARRRGCQWGSPQLHFLEGKRLRWENQSISCQEFWKNAFPERMGMFVDGTHQPSGSASHSRKHDQLLTLTPGQEGAAH